MSAAVQSLEAQISILQKQIDTTNDSSLKGKLYGELGKLEGKLCVEKIKLEANPAKEKSEDGKEQRTTEEIDRELAQAFSPLERYLTISYQTKPENTIGLLRRCEENDSVAFFPLKKETLTKLVASFPAAAKETWNDLLQAYPAAKKSQPTADKHDAVAGWVIRHLESRLGGCLTPTPKNWSNHTNEVCRYYIDNTTEDGPIPCWKQFLDRLSCPKHFLAFLWSVFDVEDMGRQIFWIQDEGGGGKSTIVRILQHWLNGGTEANGIVVAKAVELHTLKSNFGLGNTEGARLLIDSDSRLIHAVNDSRIHKITGGDTDVVERKYESAYDATVYAKILMMSNYYPVINASQPNERSRLLFGKVQPRKISSTEIGGRDLAWENGLRSERKQLLYHAKQAYVELTNESVKYVINSDEIDYTVCDSALEDLFLEMMKNQKLFFGPTLSISGTALSAKLEKAHAKQPKSYPNFPMFHADFQRFLLLGEKVQKLRRSGGIVWVGIGELAPGEELPEEVSLVEEDEPKI